MYRISLHFSSVAAQIHTTSLQARPEGSVVLRAVKKVPSKVSTKYSVNLLTENLSKITFTSNPWTMHVQVFTILFVFISLILRVYFVDVSQAAWASQRKYFD